VTPAAFSHVLPVGLIYYVRFTVSCHVGRRRREEIEMGQSRVGEGVRRLLAQT
jgi:hypothetical protein